MLGSDSHYGPRDIEGWQKWILRGIGIFLLVSCPADNRERLVPLCLEGWGGFCWEEMSREILGLKILSLILPAQCPHLCVKVPLFPQQYPCLNIKSHQGYTLIWC